MNLRVSIIIAVTAAIGAIALLSATASPGGSPETKVAGIAVPLSDLAEISVYEKDIQSHYLFDGRQPPEGKPPAAAWSYHRGGEVRVEGSFLVIRWKNIGKDLDQRDRITSINLAKANQVSLVPVDDGKYLLQISAKY